ncbi:Translation factor SUA5 [uncultured Paludibacter sp.]|uniref:L-threonylcarbamoyladenylate synthase n=1 Tax=uncultured Paludibacter sp. TaxID=497635 RepID=A0A653ACB9_9BACT|nr:Translation factor SUA5 [uncultured Paludibacter sp.]
MNDEINKALEILRSGGVILYPTDTIWGIGCDATNKKAVEKIYQIKKRAETKSMLVLLDSPAKLNAYVEEIPDMAWDLIELTTKPLTIIYPNARNLAENLIGEDRSIGIRITTEEFSKKLCERFRKPIVSTSANISGEKSPAFFDDISDEIKFAVDYIVDYRRNDKTLSKPSSIIKLGIGNLVEIIRE